MGSGGKRVTEDQGAGLSPEHRGEVFSDARPAEDPLLFGQADLSPKGAFEARSLQSFVLTYTAGRYGLDDTGAIRWERVFGGGLWDRAMAIQAVPGGGFVLAGTTTTQGFGYEDVWVLRVDANGRL